MNLAGDRGRAWLGLGAPQGRPAEWLVYHPDGRFAASAVLPPTRT